MNGSSGSSNLVAILDCGAQYGKVIDRRVRELHVESVMLPLTTTAQQLVDGHYGAVIISGGPSSVNSKESLVVDPLLFDCGIPILGICYGLQLIHKHFGGSVQTLHHREDGVKDIQVDVKCALFSGLDSTQTVLLTHGDSITEACDTLHCTAKSGNLVAGVSNEAKRIYAVQFHPEVDLTVNGLKMLENFLFKIAELKPIYTIINREQMCLDEIKRKVGHDHQVLVLVSGGVDSTVCAALLATALQPSQVIAVHVDQGFMRANETQQVIKALKQLGIHAHVYSGSHVFNVSTTLVKHANNQSMRQSAPLNQITDPELKRTIIGDTFMMAMNEMLSKLGLSMDNDKILLAQGTLRPDLIESASSQVSGHADCIKTHHNDTPLVRKLREQFGELHCITAIRLRSDAYGASSNEVTEEKVRRYLLRMSTHDRSHLRGKVIEPLRDFHKDEVRQLGRALNLPADMVDRHPFPGPGLAIRVLCATQPYMCNDFRDTELMLQCVLNFDAVCNAQSDNTYKKHIELITATLGDLSRLAQLRAVSREQRVHALLLPVRTVGVQGDSRSYSYVAALSLSTHPHNTTTPWQTLFFLAGIIPGILRNVNRVVYVHGGVVEHAVHDVTATLLTPDVIEQVRLADYYANQVLRQSQQMHTIQQMPVVLVPVHFDRVLDGTVPSVRRSVCLRPFITNDFMTGRPAVPGVDIPEQVVYEMMDAVLENVRFISRVMYDLTAKPPGTTEWE